MEDLKQNIDSTKLPNHIAITMDGNGRWATNQGQNRILGHQNGIKPVDECTEACAELGIKNLTLYAFSKQNWNRPEEEVNALMNLLVETIQNETEKLQKNNIRLKAIGDLENLPKATYDSLQLAMEETKNNDRMTLTLALSYGSRHEILEASKKLAKKLSSGLIDEEDIDEEEFGKHLYTSDMPDPDLMIRTSGEYRTSNFLLWQSAYAEFYFTEVLWPDFGRDDLYRAIIDFQKRERRFGLTSAQISI